MLTGNSGARTFLEAWRDYRDVVTVYDSMMKAIDAKKDIKTLEDEYSSYSDDVKGVFVLVRGMYSDAEMVN